MRIINLILAFLSLFSLVESKEIMKVKYNRYIADDSVEFNNAGQKWLITTKEGNKALVIINRDTAGFRYIEFDSSFNEIKYEVRLPNLPNGQKATSATPFYATNESNILFLIDTNYYTSKDAGLTTKIAPSNDLLKKYAVNGYFHESKDFVLFDKYESILFFDKDYNFIDSLVLPDSLKDVKTDYYSFFRTTMSLENKLLAYVAVFRKGAQKYKPYKMITYDMKTKVWNTMNTTNAANEMCYIDDSTMFGGTSWDRWHLLKFEKELASWVEIRPSIHYIGKILYDGQRVFYMNSEHIGYSTDKGKTWDSIKVDQSTPDLSSAFFKKEGSDLYMISNGRYYGVRKLENISSLEENTSPNQAQIQAKAIVTNVTPTQITISNVIGKALTFTTLEEANNYLLEAKGLMLIKLDFVDKEPTYLKHYFE